MSAFLENLLLLELATNDPHKQIEEEERRDKYLHSEYHGHPLLVSFYRDLVHLGSVYSIPHKILPPFDGRYCKQGHIGVEC